MADKKIDLGVVKIEELQKTSDVKQLPEFYKRSPIVNYIIHGQVVAGLVPYADPLTILMTSKEQADLYEPEVDEVIIELLEDKSIVEGLNEICNLNIKNDDQLLEEIDESGVYDRNISGYNLPFSDSRFIDYLGEVEIDLDVFLNEFSE